MKLSPRTLILLKSALAEDIGRGDLTSEILVPRGARGEAAVVAREGGIFCGEPVVRGLLRAADPSLRVRFFTRDGRRFARNKKILTLRGNIRSILKVERTLLNFLGHLSGIATLTRRYVDAVKDYPAAILDTRKTTPLWRELEKYAVRCGGGENHRFGLWDEILVKDNHWTAIWDLLDQTKCRYFSDKLRPVQSRRKIPVEVEVRNVKELAHLLEGTFVPDRILLDNFSVPNLARAVSFVHHFFRVLRGRYGIRRKRPLLEASGGIDLANVRAVARTGVDRISIGRLTHSAPALDFSLTL